MKQSVKQTTSSRCVAMKLPEMVPGDVLYADWLLLIIIIIIILYPSKKG